MRSAVSRLYTNISLASAGRNALISHLGEDDALTNRHDVVQIAQGLVFLIFAIAFQIQLLDGIDRDILLLEENLVGLGRDGLCEIADLVRECGREQDHLGLSVDTPTSSAFMSQNALNLQDTYR